jgi:agmatinase
MTFLEELADLNFVGMDCVEVAPAYDHAELTSNAASAFVWTYLSGQVAKREGLLPARTAGNALSGLARAVAKSLGRQAS